MADILNDVNDVVDVNNVNDVDNVDDVNDVFLIIHAPVWVPLKWSSNATSCWW